ncbi:hypothetical protein OG884_07565 [Streptosporangium sp. NBC_01755]|nr:hypothetical protein [Streptosporangium sp. NBC_01755]WSD01770.1 hypothetical protein OG884_07565 [Streptosporangium sp. NBC_01755]
MDRLVRQVRAADGRLAGGQHGELRRFQIEAGEVGDLQRPVVQVERALAGVGEVLSGVAGEVDAAVRGQQVKCLLAGGVGVEPCGVPVGEPAPQ